MTRKLFDTLVKQYESKVEYMGETDKKTLADLEHRLNVKLPKSCRDFMLRYGTMRFCDTETFGADGGISDCIEYTEMIRTTGLPAQYVVIEKEGTRFRCIDASGHQENACRIVTWDEEVLDERTYESFYAYMIDRMRDCFGHEEIGSAILQQRNLLKLHRMRLTATGLLALMALVYFVFRRFQTYNFFCSSVVAFSEAAMVGALADWFAVVALFRHPLGLKWIPHTAIIQNNKDRIGESLSNFVVSNFFTADVIRPKLEGIDLTEEMILYLRNNKDTISGKLVSGLPDLVNSIINSAELTDVTVTGVKEKLRNMKLYPLLGSALNVLIASGQHIPIVKELLGSLHQYVSDNKEQTLKFVEGLNRTLALPVIGDIVYKNILKTLAKQVEDIEFNADSEVHRLMMYSLPRLADRLKTSEALIEKGEKFKNEVIDSVWFDQFVHKAMMDLGEILIAYSRDSGNTLKEELNSVLDHFIGEVLSASATRERIDNFIKNSIVNVICAYRMEIARLIHDTVRDWEAHDVVDKLEMHVGADLQYIRINGTVIGGLAGLTIHILSSLLY